MASLAGPHKKRVVLILATLSLGGALLWLSTGGSAPPPRPLPPVSLTFLGLSNMSPFGLTTAYCISNGSAKRLFYAPSAYEFTSTNGLISISGSEGINAAAVLGPGQTNTFYVPAIITNQSLRVHMTLREKANPRSFRGTVESLIRKIGPKNGDAWMGNVYQGVLMENPGNTPMGTEASPR